MIRQPRLHRLSNAKRLVNPAVIIVHEVQRDVMGVIAREVFRLILE